MKRIFFLVLFLHYSAAFGCFDTDDTVPVGSLLPKAEQGDIQAQVKLANEYYEGEHPCGGGEIAGPPQDYLKAFHWFKRAADQGDSEAQFMLATMYINAQGVSYDEKAAHMWLEKAAKNGHPMARSLMKLGF